MSSQDGPGGLFSDTGSPPVILGFLAVGLFVVALIVVFGFRRMQNGRWNTPHQNFFNVNITPTLDIGEKPTLWEFYALHDEERWSNMRPICASSDRTEPSPLPPVPKLTIMQRLLTKLRFRRRRLPPEPQKLAGISTRKSVQVAVAIMMPSVPSDFKHQQDTPIYELGVTALPLGEANIGLLR